MPDSATNPNTTLRKIAALTFMTFATRGFVLPFVNLYLVSVGFSGTQIGFLVSVSALAQLILVPLMNAAADRTGRHRQLYYGLLAGNTGALLGLLASAHPVWLFGIILLRDITDMPSAALLSQLTITWLDQHGRAIYGRLRAWGSFGWAVTTLISGAIISIGGYPLLFVMAVLTNLVQLPFIRALPPRTAGRTGQPGSVPARQSGFYFLMASQFLFFVGMSGFWSFAFIYFRHELGATDQMIGLLASVGALSEIPAMVLIDRWIKRASVYVTLLLGTVGLAASWFSFVLLTDTTLLIPLMILRGTVYTLQSVSIVLLVSKISHPYNAATNQAIAQVTLPGLAGLLTGPISGWIFDHLGARVLFTFAACMGVLAGLLLIAVRRRLMPPAAALPVMAEQPEIAA